MHIAGGQLGQHIIGMSPRVLGTEPRKPAAKETSQSSSAEDGEEVLETTVT